MAHGLFIAGTGTDVGKTYVATLIVRQLVAAGQRVGIYKPVASGCRRCGAELVADDAVALWRAAGKPGALGRVCPQRFAAPLAPPRAAREEGRQVDQDRLLAGLHDWQRCSDFVVVEGVGGLMSPLSDTWYCADLAAACGYPLVVVAPNVLGTINATLQTLITARTICPAVAVAAVVVNDVRATAGDPSAESNRVELEQRRQVPTVTAVSWQGQSFAERVDWLELARNGRGRHVTPGDHQENGLRA